MSIKAEKALLGLLTDKESLDVLLREGFNTGIMPTEELGQVVDWSMTYISTSGKAPTVLALTERFGDLLSDMEVDVSEIPDESIEWAVEQLTFTFGKKIAADITRSMAREVATSTPETILEVLSEHSAVLGATVSDMAPQTTRVDMRERGQAMLDAYELAASQEDGISGLTFGLTEIDHHYGGIRDGEVAVFASPAKVGKAQPLDEPVLTPSGWVPMGSLGVGDEVVGSDGAPTRVVQVHPQGKIPVYRVTMDDGTSTRACADHRWQIQSRDQRTTGSHSVVDTLELVRRMDAGRKTYLPVVQAVQHPEVDLPLDPYIVGALLGDGGMSNWTPRLTKQDADFHQMVREALPEDAHMTWETEGMTSRLVGVTSRLREIGMQHVHGRDKRIPAAYLTASIEQRRSLLAGLLDSDGYRYNKNTGYCSSSLGLVEDVRELVLSLGGRCSAIRSRDAWFTVNGERREGSPSHRMSIRFPSDFGCPFRTARKSQAWHESQPLQRVGREPSRWVVSVEPEGEEESQCITVDAEDHLYVTSGYIVTHNSAWLIHLALNDWRRGRSPALVTLENSIEMTEMRIACQALHLDYQELERGTLSAQEHGMLVEWVHDVLTPADNPLHILQPPPGQRTAISLVQQAQALSADSLLVDQLTFVEPVRTRKDLSKAYEVAETMRHFKTGISSGRHKMPLALAHQVTRDGVKSAGQTGRLQMSHMADSSEVERAADMLFGLYASEEQRQHNGMELQALAVRRVQPVSYDLHWRIHMGFVNVQYTLTEEDLA